MFLGGYDYGFAGYPMAAYTPDGLFVPQPYAAQYYYQNPQQPLSNVEEEILKGKIKKQMYVFKIFVYLILFLS